MEQEGVISRWGVISITGEQISDKYCSSILTSIYEQNKMKTIWGSIDEKNKSPPGSSQISCFFSCVLFSFYFYFYWYLYWFLFTLGNICHAMAAIAIKHMCALSE